MLESRGHSWFFLHGVIAFLCFDLRDVADRLQQPTIVEPIYSFQRGELHGLQ